jgi:hypothetical protein
MTEPQSRAVPAPAAARAIHPPRRADQNILHLTPAQREPDVNADIRVLFEDEAIDAKELFKQKEVLDHIEHAVDYCDNVGDILANLAVKNG